MFEQGADRRIELRGVVEQPARLVQELEPFVLLALADIGAIGHEHDGRRDREQDDRPWVDQQDHDRERREAGIGHRHHLAEAQHLGQQAELRGATGQRDGRRNERRLERAGGAGRDECRQPLAWSGRQPQAWRSRGRSIRATTAARLNWARLNARLTPDWFRSSRSARPVPKTQAATYSVGGSRNRNATPGTSLSENECRSRRKWMSTTFVSPRKNATAASGHGMWNPDRRRRRCRARPPDRGSRRPRR